MLCHALGMAQSQGLSISVGTGGGMDFIRNRDLSTSPLRYKGAGLPIGINGLALNNTWLHQCEGRMIWPGLTNNYPLKNPANRQLTSWTKVDLQYTLLRSLKKEGKDYLGASINSNYFFRTYHFFNSMGWEFQNSLHLCYARRIKLSDRSMLLSQCSLAAFGFLHRKPSLTLDEAFLDDYVHRRIGKLLTYGQWKFHLDDWIMLNIDILYQWNMTEHFNLQSRVGLHYYRIAFPEQVKQLNFPLRCYVNYHF